MLIDSTKKIYVAELSFFCKPYLHNMEITSLLMSIQVFKILFSIFMTDFISKAATKRNFFYKKKTAAISGVRIICCRNKVCDNETYGISHESSRGECNCPSPLFAKARHSRRNYGPRCQGDGLVRLPTMKQILPGRSSHMIGFYPDF